MARAATRHRLVRWHVDLTAEPFRRTAVMPSRRRRGGFAARKDRRGATPTVRFDGQGDQFCQCGSTVAKLLATSACGPLQSSSE